MRVNAMYCIQSTEYKRLQSTNTCVLLKTAHPFFDGILVNCQCMCVKQQRKSPLIFVTKGQLCGQFSILSDICTHTTDRFISPKIEPTCHAMRICSVYLCVYCFLLSGKRFAIIHVSLKKINHYMR